jgi:hypothetical protein
MINSVMEAATVMLYHPAWQCLLSSESTLCWNIEFVHNQTFTSVYHLFLQFNMSSVERNFWRNQHANFPKEEWIHSYFNFILVNFIPCCSNSQYNPRSSVNII